MVGAALYPQHRDDSLTDCPAGGGPAFWLHILLPVQREQPEGCGPPIFCLLPVQSASLVSTLHWRETTA